MWGWNNEGQMGLDLEQKVIATPTFVEFKDESGKILDLRIVKVQCTSVSLVCLTGILKIVLENFCIRTCYSRFT